MLRFSGTPILIEDGTGRPLTFYLVCGGRGSVGWWAKGELKEIVEAVIRRNKGASEQVRVDIVAWFS